MAVTWEENPEYQKQQAYTTAFGVALLVVYGVFDGFSTGDWRLLIVGVGVFLGFALSWAFAAGVLIVVMRLLERKEMSAFNASRLKAE